MPGDGSGDRPLGEPPATPPALRRVASPEQKAIAGPDAVVFEVFTPDASVGGDWDHAGGPDDGIKGQVVQDASRSYGVSWRVDMRAGMHAHGDSRAAAEGVADLPVASGLLAWREVPSPTAQSGSESGRKRAPGAGCPSARRKGVAGSCAMLVHQQGCRFVGRRARGCAP